MPIDEIAPALPGPTLSSQYWENLTFLHWPIAAAEVARLFPIGVAPDVFDDETDAEPRTYVGLVPFQMRGAGPGRVPVPYLGRFYETNVRLYSVDGQGRHGIVFCTLEAQRLATVLLARAVLGLPYAWSSMSAGGQDGILRYRTRRRWPEPAGAGGEIAVRPLEPVTPTKLETWLTSRWGLHTEVAGRTVWVPNWHAPWPLRAAELVTLDCDLLRSCGVVVDESRMLRPLWTSGVRTRFGRPRLVR